jgi:multidrug efflux system membrane fusion protein
VLLLLLGAAAFLLLRGRPGSAPHATGRSGASAPQTVGIATAAPADMPITDAGLGTVTPLATVTVRTQIAGELQTIGFREGQMVHQGDFLAQIDPRPTEALLQQARGNLARDQGLLRQAQTDAARYSRLNKQDSISRQQVEDQQFIVQQDQGTVAADQGAINTQLVNLAYCHIVSPVSGRVGLRQVDAGNYVQTSDTNGIVIVTQLQPISVIFTLPEDDVPAIQKQLHAGAKLAVTVLDRSNTIPLGTGTLETLDNQIDTTTGTVKLRAILPNTDLALFPNQFVNATLLIQTLSGILTVPNAAVQNGAPGSFVYVVGQDSTVSVKPVKIGVADASHTQIISGIAAGDRVVIDGADRLRDGMKVVLPGASAAHRHRAKQAE